MSERAAATYEVAECPYGCGELHEPIEALGTRVVSCRMARREPLALPQGAIQWRTVRRAGK